MGRVRDRYGRYQSGHQYATNPSPRSEVHQVFGVGQKRTGTVAVERCRSPNHAHSGSHKVRSRQNQKQLWSICAELSTVFNQLRSGKRRAISVETRSIATHNVDNVNHVRTHRNGRLTNQSMRLCARTVDKRDTTVPSVYFWWTTWTTLV